MFKFNSIDEAIDDIRQGKMIIVIDDEDRENEADLILAAQMVTPEAINFMAMHARGLICMPMEEARLKALNIHPMVENNTDNHETAFTVSIDHYETTTGISAFERSLTIAKTLDENAKAEDFRRPGHIFPFSSERGWSIKKNWTYRSSSCRLGKNGWILNQRESSAKS